MNHEFCILRFEEDKLSWFCQISPSYAKGLYIYYYDKWLFDSPDYETEQYMKLCEGLSNGEPMYSIMGKLDMGFFDQPSLPFRWTYLWVDILAWTTFAVDWLWTALYSDENFDELDINVSELYELLYPKNNNGD
jgi:hypothetical protein